MVKTTSTAAERMPHLRVNIGAYRFGPFVRYCSAFTDIDKTVLTVICVHFTSACTCRLQQLRLSISDDVI